LVKIVEKLASFKLLQEENKSNKKEAVRPPEN
jgi:hypothetical protein